jgi:hypothetical protein
MMPIQFSSEQSLRVIFFLLAERFGVRSVPQWGQNLAHNGAGFWHFSQVSLGIGAPQSKQVISITTRFWYILVKFVKLGQLGASANSGLRLWFRKTNLDFK